MTDAALPAGLGQAFRVAVAELGLCSASWMFVDEIGRAGGAALIDLLRDELGRDWPVLDAVAAAYVRGERPRAPDADALLRVCGNVDRLVCVGIEAAFLDVLARATSARISLVRQSVFGPDWERVAANYHGRIALEGLDTFQRLAGPRSALVTFAYGTGAVETHVLPAWTRVWGEDVRTQFRSLVAWEVLRHPFFVYPRWLVPTPRGAFSAVVGA